MQSASHPHNTVHANFGQEHMLPHFIGGHWVAGNGPNFRSTNPATGTSVWEGNAASPKEVDAAVIAARNAFGAWSQTPFEARLAIDPYPLIRKAFVWHRFLRN